MEWTPRARLTGGLIASLILVGLTALSLWSIAPPAPRDDRTPTTEFSADRAFRHVERVAAQPHVTGSQAAADVRSYLQTTLTELGLETEIQDSVGGMTVFGGYQMAHVRNVIARLPGQDPTGRLFLVAHYDSVQVSSGANDDGAGVATLLETARALAAGPRPRNDIVLVFTDAEEACLCGAEAFVTQHRYAAGGGVVLNVESSGSTGPVITFETSEGNADVMRVYADAVPHPVATSFAVEVYRLLSYDTDFSPFRQTPGFTGLNSAFIDGSAVYHSPDDIPSSMDRASLQNHGDNTLALARAFGAADLGPLARPSAGDATYFPAFGQLARYPGWLVWPLAALALLAVAALAVVVRRRDLVTWPRVAAGFGLALVPIVLAPLLTQALWQVLIAVRPPYGQMIDPWRPEWFRLGVVALVATVVLTWYGLLRRRLGAWSLALGGLFWLALLGIALAALTPGGSYLAALPALAAAVAGLVASRARRAWSRLLALTVGGAVGVVILAPTVALFFPALGLKTAGASAFFAVVLGLVLLPVIEYLYPPAPVIPVQASASTVESVPPRPPANRRVVVVAGHRRWAATPATVAGALTLALVATGLAVDRFDAAHPTRTHLMYALDSDTGQALWLSEETDPGEWTGQYVDHRTDVSATFPIVALTSTTDLFVGPAPATDLAPPILLVDSDTTERGQRDLALTLRSERAVRLMYVQVLSDAPLVRAVAAGRRVPIDPVGTEPFSFVFHGVPEAGLTLRLTLDGPAPVRLRVMDGSDGLGALPGFRPRPPGFGVAGSHDSDLVLVAKTYTVSG